MKDLSELYQQIIIDHSQQPHNFRELSGASHRQEGYNPLCGDQVTLYLKEKDGIIEDVSFQGSGCAISMASTSLMSDAIKNHTVDEVMTLFREFQGMVKNGHLEEKHNLGKLATLIGVAEFPMRVKCATLPWHTLRAALLGEKQTTSTE